MPQLTAPPSCPSCGQTTKQRRAGTNPSGTARRECRHYGRTYTPIPNPHGYDLALRLAALKMYVDGLNFWRITRHLSVNPQTVINWVNAAAANLPAPPPPSERHQEGAAEGLELDELYTFVSQKKSEPTSSPV